MQTSHNYADRETTSLKIFTKNLYKTPVIRHNVIEQTFANSDNIVSHFLYKYFTTKTSNNNKTTKAKIRVNNYTVSIWQRQGKNVSNLISSHIGKEKKEIK
jgi:hypothetical protein